MKKKTKITLMLAIVSVPLAIVYYIFGCEALEDIVETMDRQDMAIGISGLVMIILIIFYLI